MKRRFSWLVVFIILSILTLMTVKQQEEKKMRNLSVLRSSFSVKPEGTKALYLTLTKLGYKVSRWRNEWRYLNLRQRNAFLFIVEPIPAFVPIYGIFKNSNFLISPKDWDQLIAFAEVGNIVWISSETESTINGKTLGSKRTSKGTVLNPSSWLKGVNRYIIKSPTRMVKRWKLPVPGKLEGLGDYQEIPLLGDRFGTTLKVIKVKDGFIVLDCNPYALSNEGIGKGDHLMLVLNILNSLPGRKQVFFDEWGRGLGEARHWWWLVSDETRFAISQIIIALVIFIFAVGIRFGKPIPMRSSPFAKTAFVDGLALLLIRGGVLPELLPLLRLHFLRQALRDHYLKSEPDETELKRRLKSLPAKEQDMAWKLWQWSNQLQRKRNLKAKHILEWTKATWQFLNTLEKK